MTSDRKFEETERGAFAFLWTRPEGGFQWKDFGGEPWLCWPLVPGSQIEMHAYPPLGEPNLHRRFAALKPTQAAIRRFAGRFGLLTIDLEHDVYIAQSVPLPDSWRTLLDRQGQLLNGDDGSAWVGESQNKWFWAIRDMAQLLEVWDLVREGDTAKLGQWVKWRQSPTRVWFERSHTDGVLEQELLADEGVPGGPLILAGWRFGDPIEPAKLYVCQEINKRLKDVTPAVLPFVDGEIHFFPKNLLTALYVLLAQEVSGRVRPPIECLGCGVYFSPKDGHQRYHETNCRKKHWWHESPVSPKNKDTQRDGGQS